MSKTVVGVYRNFADAQLIVQELLKEGVPRNNLSIVAKVDGSDLVGEPYGLQRRTLPDGSELMATGPLGDALSASGVAATGYGLSPALSSSYRNLVRNDKVLVAAQVPEDRVGSVSTLMNRYSVSDFELNQQLSGQAEVTLPVVQEELQVGKREVERGGVHVVTYVTEQPVEGSVRLREEHVSVERHPVDRPVAPGDATAFQEGTFEVRQHAEVPVVSKEARVVEEVIIGKKVTEHTETVRDTVRRTEVAVEELGTKGQRAQAAANTRGAKGV